VDNKKRIKKGLYYYFAVYSSIVILILIPLWIEQSMYKNIHQREFPGDCGTFVSYVGLVRSGQNMTLAQVTYEMNPWTTITGPESVRKELEKHDVFTTYYNQFTLEEAKQKLSEKKGVILLINTNSGGWTNLGATHFVYLVDYDDEGFYFYDSYYWGSQYYEATTQEEAFKPFYMTSKELEEKRKNVLSSTHLWGLIENMFGFKNFALVVGEDSKDRLPLWTLLGLKIEYLLEKKTEKIARIIALLSPRV